MPVEFECKDIGNQNCGFKTEANTPEELISKVNQHVRSAHGMNPTDAQERVERAIKEKESWRQSGSITGETGSMANETGSAKSTTYGQESTSSWNQPSGQGMQTTTGTGGTGSTYESAKRPGQPGWQTQRFGEQQGEQYRQTGQERGTAQDVDERTGTQSGMRTTDTEYGGTGSMPTQRGRNVTQTTTASKTVEDEEVEE